MSTKALADRLAQAGLDRREIELLVSLYGPTIFAADSLTVAWRIPAGMVDELTPLVVEPEPAKAVRVVLVVARNLDPKIEASLQTLVDQLGSPQYKDREAAEQRLVELGSLAYGVLKKSLTSKDSGNRFSSRASAAGSTTADRLARRPAAVVAQVGHFHEILIRSSLFADRVGRGRRLSSSRRGANVAAKL